MIYLAEILPLIFIKVINLIELDSKIEEI